MKRTLLALAMIALGTIMMGTSAAQAYCSYGPRNLGGSLSPYDADSSRSYTITGSAVFTVLVRSGGPLRVNIGCGLKTIYQNHSCRVYGNGETFVYIANPNGRVATYRWICDN